VVITDVMPSSPRSSPVLSILYNENHVIHKPFGTSPENPERTTRIFRYFQGKKEVLGEEVELRVDFPPATVEDLLRVHQKEYIDFVRSYCLRGGGFLGDSTYFAPGTFDAALSAAGGAMKALEMVVTGTRRFTFALIRPPGHHAKADTYGGFCIFNNVAVAIRHVQENFGVEKVMVVDWDAHAANGTMRIFYEDPTVLLVSLHKDPKEFYPGEGFVHQIGRGKGRGYTVNVEMPEGAGDREYLMVFEDIIRPVYEQYSPDLLVGCVGFDAHFSEEMTHMGMTSQGYYDLVRGLSELGGERLALVLEGGYNWYNPRLAHTVVNAMLGRPHSFKEDVDILSSSVTRPEKVYKITRQKIKEVQDILDQFYRF